MDVLFLLSAHESVRFLFVCRERPACRSHPAWVEKGNGTHADPYEVNVGMHHFAGIQKSFWCVLRNGRCPFPTLHYLGIAHLAAAKLQVAICHMDGYNGPVNRAEVLWL